VDQLASEITDAYADVLTRFESIESHASTRPTAAAAWWWRDIGEQTAEELRNQLNNWVAWTWRRATPGGARRCWAVPASSGRTSEASSSEPGT